ncbi:MAG TPA: serine/threonine-protein kinase [Polyangiales bacterium]|nr:serine/threonine-protein kinase [Polyangiales bacterium]
MEPELGTVIAGRYRLVRELGRGGMGVVIEAENVVTGRQVAVKWLHPSLAGNQEASMRLMREATATCRIRHPNVVDVYDVINEGDAIYLVMELLEGEPLEALLDRGGVPFHELIALIIPAMRGVAEAHRLGIIHRDVHPANIFLAKAAHSTQAVPKVLDFGISKIASDGPSLTRSGTTLGTPLYMSYEQLCNARDVDQRADVYSFGVILYEALTGQSPFWGETFAELAVKIATGTPVPPKQLVPTLPTALDRIIQWAIARDREDRIPDLQTLIRELEPFASQHAFRSQMTEAELAMPRLQPRGEASESRNDAPAPSIAPAPPVTPTPATPRATLPVTTPINVSEKRLEATDSVPPPARSSSPVQSLPPPRRKPLLSYGLGALVLVALGVFVLWQRFNNTSSPIVVGASLGNPPAAIPSAPAAIQPPAIQPPAQPALPTPPAAPAPSAPVAEIPHGALPPEAAPASKAVLTPKPAVQPAAKPRPRGPNGEFRAGRALQEDFKD